MLIENRKTEKRSEISPETWAKIVELKYKNLFRIIDGTNTPSEIQSQKVEIPTIIKEFQAIKKDVPAKKTKPHKK